MSTIRLSDMRFFAYHGCFEAEQIVGTWFSVDLAFETDTTKAEVSDDLADTVSYLDVYRVVKAEMQQPSHVMEHVARRIVDAVSQTFSNTSHIQIRIRKLNPPLGGEVGNAEVELLRMEN